MYQLFGEILLDRGLIDDNQLEEALYKQKSTMANKKIGEILQRLNYISKSHIIETLSEQLDIPIVKLDEREIPERIRGLIDGQVATVYRVIPIEEEDNVLKVATADPTNINQLDNLRRLLDRQVEPVLSTVEDISQALGKYYGLNEKSVESMLSTVSSASSLSSLSSMSNMSSMGDTFNSFGSMSASDISMSSIGMDSMSVDDVGAALKDDDEPGKGGSDESPVVKYVQQMIMEAYRLRASDIHVEPQKFTVRVRYRVDGVMQVMPDPPKRAQAAIISRLKIMAGLDIAQKRVPQDGRIKLSMPGKAIDLRVSSLPSSHGESIVMRILDKSGLLLGLGQLGFSAEIQETWERLLGHSTGVILVTGPTGSGKTTTLYASLHNLNQPDTKLITVEDPVEYQIAGINQVQIHHEIGWDFTRALRAIFRQDPDVVMVGEIRDLETAEIAIKAALTGHLVFSTLHTNDTASSCTRLVDIGIKPFLVASGVRAILAQRLLRTICNNCKTIYHPPDVEFDRLGFDVPDRDRLELYHGAGCDNCSNSGCQGRLGAYELFLNNDNLREMIMRGESSTALKRQARKDGMKTMRDDAWHKCLNGITTIEEVNRRTRVDEPLEKLDKNKPAEVAV